MPSSKIDMHDIAHLRALLAKATPGPWRIGLSEREVCGDPEDGCWYSVAYTPNPRSPPRSARHRGWLDDAAIIVSHGYEPIMAFDDRDRVVKMWRDAGIPCAQVAPGDF